MTEHAIVKPASDWRAHSTVRKLHGWNARLLGVFISIHLLNHLTILSSVETHLAVMETLRTVTYFPLIQYPLYILFFFQIVLGLILARKNWKPQSRWAWAQVVSGLMIAFFAIQHLTAAVYSRWAFDDFDTNVFWAASVVSQPPLSLYFIPYYFIGVSAVFVHIASALHFAGVGVKHNLPKLIIVAGLGVAFLIVAGLTGTFEPFTLPAENQRYLQEIYGS